MANDYQSGYGGGVARSTGTPPRPTTSSVETRNGITFAQFIYGEVGQESGGNYAAQSPAGALGKYQILSSNIPSWSKEILGYSITPQQFLANPNLQDAIAIGKLYKYWQAYGPEGAASAWYTGSPTAYLNGGGGDRYGGPSAAGYVYQVMQRAKGYRGNGSDLTHSGHPIENGGEVKQLSSAQGGGSGPTGGTAGNSALLHPDAATFQQALGPLAGLLGAVPELKGLLNNAVSHGWSIDKFVNTVQNSEWYRDHSANARQMIALRSADPVEYERQISRQRDAITTQMEAMGVSLNGGQLNALALDDLIGGWDTPTLQRHISSIANYHFGGNWNASNLSGNAAAAYQQLIQLYHSYGVPVSAYWLASHVKEMVSGQTSLDTYKQHVMTVAKSMYPSIAKQIDDGMTVQQIADPYRQSMGSLLEMNPDTISLDNPLIKRALQGTTATDSRGNATHTSMPVWQFENQVRNDPRWQYTSNAHDQMASTLMQLGQDWGYE